MYIVQPISWPARWSHDWLIATIGWGLATLTAHAHKRRHHIYRCQNQCIISFTHRAPRQVKIIEFVLNSVSSQILGFTGCCVLHSVVLHVILTWGIKSLDRKCSVLFPLNINRVPIYSRLGFGKFQLLKLQEPEWINEIVLSIIIRKINIF